MKTETKDLLNRATFEIKSLRHQNEIMTARLTMFDDMMYVLNSRTPELRGQGMSPDLVWEIDNHIAKTASDHE